MEEKIRLAAKDFEEKGFAIIESFLTDSDIEEIKQECRQLIYQHLNETDDGDGQQSKIKRNIFGNDHNSKNQYFLDSANIIGFFYEKNAIDETNGQLLVDPEKSVAKIGHALHCLNNTFNKFTNNFNIKELFSQIKFIKPTVVQSMVIFKNPHVGGEYTPHQDASFICTEPEIKVAGIWYALDDATLENGCLQFIPGSHKWPLKRKFVLTNTNKNNQQSDEQQLIRWTQPEIDYDDKQFVQVPVSKGSLVLIHGLVVHRSSRNNSLKPRWAYTFHVFDDTSQSQYSKDNWLQNRNNRNTFMPLLNE